MKLNEKIYACRKKAGLSQEALAERIGVSRQAISKWETGEAAPEISKLPLLARVFGVTADWLLDDAAEPEEPIPDEEPVPEPESRRMYSDTPVRAYPEWVDKMPRWIGGMIKRYGWLYGVRMAISGAIFMAFGFVGKAMFSSVTRSFNGMVDGMFPAAQNAGITVYDAAGNVVDPSHFGLSGNELMDALGVGSSAGFSPFGGVNVTASVSDPASILTNFVIIIGLVMLVGGALLAWYLKKWGEREA